MSGRPRARERVNALATARDRRLLPHDVMLYAVLRKVHTILAYFFFLTFIAHFGAILFHTLIVRDGMLNRMLPWNIQPNGASMTAKEESRVNLDAI